MYALRSAWLRALRRVFHVNVAQCGPGVGAICYWARIWLILLAALIAFAAQSSDAAPQQPIRPTPEIAAKDCQAILTQQLSPDQKKNNFIKCWNNAEMTSAQRHVYQCVGQNLDQAGNPDHAGQMALCSAGVALTPQAKDVVTCLGKTPGDLTSVASCAAKGPLNDKQKAALGCIVGYMDNLHAAALCVASDGLPPDQAHALTCLMSNKDHPTGALTCIGAGHLSPEQQRQVACITEYPDDVEKAGLCIALPKMSPDQRRLISCVSDHQDNLYGAAICAGGSRLSPDEQRIASCVSEHYSDYAGAAVCAGGSHLSNAQMIVAECAISSAGGPYAFAVCVAEQYTVQELTKCLETGKVGGDKGCFGKNNDMVKLVNDSFNGVKLSVELAQNPNLIWGGPNSFAHNPSQVWGGKNSVVNNPGQLAGGNNSIARKPLGDFGNQLSKAFGKPPAVPTPGQIIKNPVQAAVQPVVVIAKALNVKLPQAPKIKL
jgi:hypothetical protein